MQSYIKKEKGKEDYYGGRSHFGDFQIMILERQEKDGVDSGGDTRRPPRYQRPPPRLSQTAASIGKYSFSPHSVRILPGKVLNFSLSV